MWSRAMDAHKSHELGPQTRLKLAATVCGETLKQVILADRKAWTTIYTQMKLIN